MQPTTTPISKTIRLYKAKSTMYKHFQVRMEKAYPEYYMSYLAGHLNGTFSTQMSKKDKSVKPVHWFKVYDMKY
jgi:hypothetical protein